MVRIWLLDEGKGDAMADSSGKGHDGEFHGGFKLTERQTSTIITIYD